MLRSHSFVTSLRLQQLVIAVSAAYVVLSTPVVNRFIMPNPGDSPAADEEASRIAQKLHLAPGKVFADVGSNDGFWTMRVLRHVLPGGRAYATDALPDALEALKSRVPADLVTVRNLLADNKGLPANSSLDAIMMRMSFHYDPYPAAAAAAYYKALKPGGLVWIAEHPGCDDPFGAHLTPDDIASRIPVDADPTMPANPLSISRHRLQYRPLKLIFLAAGFRVVEKGWWPWFKAPCSYYVVFQKPTAAYVQAWSIASAGAQVVAAITMLGAMAYVLLTLWRRYGTKQQPQDQPMSA